MNILLVDRNVSSAQTTDLVLKAGGHSVTVIDMGEDAVDYATIYDYDLIVINPSLVDKAGEDVVKGLRTKHVETPILIISTTIGIEDRVRALDAGADDYLTFPFHAEELRSRVNAIVRRAQGYSHPQIVVGDLVFDTKQRRLFVGEKLVHLTVREYQMLELLALRKGTTLTKEMFLNHMYGGRDEPEIKIIDVFICKIRKKLSQATGAGIDAYVRTVWGRGYFLAAPDQVAA